MSSHSRMSPSSAHRWLTCTASVKLIESLPPKKRNTSSKYALDGIKAHKEAEKLIERYKLAELPPELDTPTDPHIVKYYNYVRGLSYNCVTAVEKRVTYFADQGGTLDFLAYNAGSRTLCIVDLKYGKGVKVFSRDNEQMKLYALGALNEYSEVDRVYMHIFQPRADNTNWALITKEELLEFEREVKDTIERIERDDVETKPSASACRFCAYKKDCDNYQSVKNQLIFDEF